MSSTQIPSVPFTNDNHQPTDLFLSISRAAAQRQRESIQRRKKQQDLERAWKEEHVLKPQRVKKEEDEAIDKARKMTADVFEKELTLWRERRDKESARDYLSRAEVDEEVRRLVEGVIQGFGMVKRRMEDGTEEEHDVWRERMIDLRKQIYRVWNENYVRIRMGLPRYVEGYPVRDGIFPPKFMPGKRQKMSGLRGCLQCEVKRLACSMSVQSRWPEEGLAYRRCRRCEADGDRCIIQWEEELVEEGKEEELVEEGKEEEEGGEGKEKEKKVNYIWDWWDGAPEREPDTDSAAEAVEIWERRQRGARLEPVGGVMQWIEAGGFAPRCVDTEE